LAEFLKLKEEEGYSTTVSLPTKEFEVFEEKMRELGHIIRSPRR